MVVHNNLIKPCQVRVSVPAPQTDGVDDVEQGTGEGSGEEDVEGLEAEVEPPRTRSFRNDDGAVPVAPEHTGRGTGRVRRKPGYLQDYDEQ